MSTTLLSENESKREFKICETCGDKFYWKYKTKDFWKTRRFCSKGCVSRNSEIREKKNRQWHLGLSQEKHPRWKGGKPHCIDCNKQLAKRTAKRCVSCFHNQLVFRNKLRKYAASKKGSKNPNWKGGITPVYKKLRASFDYEEWRTKVFERDNYTCQDCGEVGGRLHADHIKNWANYPDLRLEVSNGRTLCIPCHYFKTFNKVIPENSSWGIRKIK